MRDAIRISNVIIKINDEGLFCINDMHKASGGHVKHTPAKWLRSSKVKDIISELETVQKRTVSKEPGRRGGTFVCWQLVYSYAMWIGPKFHIEVIESYDKHRGVNKSLASLVNNVEQFAASLTSQLNSACLTIDNLKAHGSKWGNYGVSIKKANKECRKVLEDLKDQIQLKLDFK